MLNFGTSKPRVKGGPRAPLDPHLGWGLVSQHALQVVSQHALQVSGGGWYPSMPCRSPDPHPRRKLRGLAWGGLLAHTQGGSWGFWPGVVSRPTPRGGLQAHTQGGSPGPHLGVSQHALRQTSPQQMATPAGSTHPTGMHSCSMEGCNFHKLLRLGNPKLIKMHWYCS